MRRRRRRSSESRGGRQLRRQVQGLLEEVQVAAAEDLRLGRHLLSYLDAKGRTVRHQALANAVGAAEDVGA